MMTTRILLDIDSRISRDQLAQIWHTVQQTE